MTRQTPLVEMNRIEVRFGQITALHSVDLQLAQGEVLALLGDNGAGKSTLIKTLTGILRPLRGDIRLSGERVEIISPAAARDRGIEAVYQDLALVPMMSISRNFFLGRELTHRAGPLRWLDEEEMDQQATTALSNIGIEIRDPGEPVERLSGGERQSIAIGRAVHFGSRILILDEPTSALSIGETEKVLGYIDAARRRGLGVIFITHNLDHVYRVADRLTVLHQGRSIADQPIREVSPEEAARLIMTGSV